MRLTKNVENYSVFLEDQSGRDAEAYKLELAMALALETSKSLVQVRGGIADPAWMTAEAQKIAAGGGDLIKEVRILVDQELVAQGMNLFYNVGKGAVSKPRGVFIHYVGRPEEADVVDMAIVGKGVTYDTGGLNVKPTGGMELMYGDKGGSCAVLGALKGTLELKVKKNVVFACGFAENAIGADCYKPSDILRAMNGLSVEIGNTDAEGRLVMADTMTYVQRNFKPKKVTYIATLTGASVVALGKTTGGLFSTDDTMVADWKKASENSHEALWHMPLNAEHRESIKGKYGADISNMGAYRWGGASQAAAFLEHFVEDKRPWAHLDIAGPGVFGEHD